MLIYVRKKYRNQLIEIWFESVMSDVNPLLIKNTISKINHRIKLTNLISHILDKLKKLQIAYYIKVRIWKDKDTYIEDKWISK